MRIVTCIVGYGKWNEFTRPLDTSIRRHEKEAEIVIVSNGNYPPYPPAFYIHRVEKNIGYAHGMNEAVEFAGPADWYVILNNDVLCEAPFLHMIKDLNPNVLYGMEYNSNQPCGVYLCGWLYVISKHLWDTLGGFDPEFVGAAFEDADFSRRAVDAGFELDTLPLPFEHFGKATRFEDAGYDEIKAGNLQRYIDKHG